MKKRGEITAFYVETLLMVLVMIGILLVLAKVFGLAKGESVRAKRLTEAVTLAASTAEVLSAEEDIAAAGEKIGLEEWTVVPGGANTEEAGANQAAASGSGVYRWRRNGLFGKQISTEVLYQVKVTRTKVSEDLAEDVIEIFAGGGSEPIYSLEITQFRPGKEGS